MSTREVAFDPEELAASGKRSPMDRASGERRKRSKKRSAVKKAVVEQDSPATRRLRNRQRQSKKLSGK